ncbi:tannase-domain-containing protein [Teratosphaeria nubilosa]|uniref:Carboxylic ester hydrolase n=1 Tax=Teratosphaeria nubilosa TaxID=161662 RepID=A0A6G1L4N0_9PEZI|nr:tannase-domain-containing protein [Teratosphaeria nubilosa]
MSGHSGGFQERNGSMDLRRTADRVCWGALTVVHPPKTPPKPPCTHLVFSGRARPAWRPPPRFPPSAGAGAVAGHLDGGFGLDVLFSLANATANWEATCTSGYQAIWEDTIIGEDLAEKASNTSRKVYSYYQGCSEGGSEEWSQVQRFADAFDGAVIGAPAFRYAFQQVYHVFSSLVEVLQGYYPPRCELEAIVNATITACDPLDRLHRRCHCP